MITDNIRAFLEQRIEVEKKDGGMVAGLVDEHGSSIVSLSDPVARYLPKLVRIRMTKAK